jgi:hypothetical protein
MVLKDSVCNTRIMGFFLFLIALMLTSQSSSATVYFRHDAETDPISYEEWGYWDGYRWTDVQEDFTRSQEVVKNGSWAIRAEIDNASQDIQTGKGILYPYDAPSGGNPNGWDGAKYYSAWYYVAEGFSDEFTNPLSEGIWKNQMQFKMRNGNGDKCDYKGVKFVLGFVNGNWDNIETKRQLAMGVRDCGLSWGDYPHYQPAGWEHKPCKFRQLQNAVEIPDDTWVHIELFYNIAETNGEVSIWQDGQLLFNISDPDLNTLSIYSDEGQCWTDIPYLYFGVGCYASAESDPSNLLLYIDDVMITDYQVSAEFCSDVDGDGYGDPEHLSCDYPQKDCNDSNPNINPGMPEICSNGIDDDCDGFDDCNDPDCSSDPACLGATLVLSIPKTHRPPSIDGDLSDFMESDEILLSNPRGNSGKYRLLWDETALYIAADVSDTQLNSDNNERDGRMWQDDALEILFDTLHDAGPSQIQDDYKFFVNLLNYQRDERGGSGSTWNCSYTSVAVPYGTVNTPGDTDTGYTIEVAIHWSEWGISPPSFGDIWGMEIVLDDRNDIDNTIQTTWANTNGGSLNTPDGWGNLMFTHRADTSQNSCIETNELVSFVDRWKISSKDVPMPELMEAIGLWNTGCT